MMPRARTTFPDLRALAFANASAKPAAAWGSRLERADAALSRNAGEPVKRQTLGQLRPVVKRNGSNRSRRP